LPPSAQIWWRLFSLIASISSHRNPVTFIRPPHLIPGPAESGRRIHNNSTTGEVFMRSMFVKLMSTVMLFGALALAQSGDAMKQDEMKHDDNMKHDDSMKKGDSMKKDDMAKDSRKKKSKKAKKDEMKKKDEMNSDESMTHQLTKL